MAHNPKYPPAGRTSAGSSAVWLAGAVSGAGSTVACGSCPFTTSAHLTPMANLAIQATSKTFGVRTWWRSVATATAPPMRPSTSSVKSARPNESGTQAWASGPAWWLSDRRNPLRLTPRRVALTLSDTAMRSRTGVLQ
jgi:hypothetical protein